MSLPGTFPYSSIVAKTKAKHLFYAHWKPSAVAYKVRISTATLVTANR